MLTLYQWLTKMPFALDLAMVLSLTVGFAAGGTFVARALFARIGFAKNQAIAAALITGLGGLNALMFAFAIAQLWTNFRTVQQNVAAEAIAIGALHDDIRVYPKETYLELDAIINRYVADVVYDEWPKMRDGFASREADDTLYLLSQRLTSPVLPAVETAIRNDEFKQLADTQRLRQQRLDSLKSAIVPLIWFGLLAVSALLITSVFLFNTEDARFHYALAVMFGLGIGVAISVAIGLDYPFQGITPIPPTPLYDLLIEQFK